MSILFLVLGLLPVFLFNFNTFDALNFSNREQNLFTSLYVLFCCFAPYILRKNNKIGREKYILIIELIIFDLFCLLYIKLNPVTYVLQVIVIGAYFVYEWWKEKH